MRKKRSNPKAKPILSTGQLWCVSFHTVVNNDISLLGIIGPCNRVFQTNFACDSLKWLSVCQITAELLSKSCSEHQFP